MYSAKWNQREKGVQEFTNEMKNAFEMSKKLPKTTDGADESADAVGQQGLSDE
jgi:hypothetical protein|tara:strand:- start:400 stop:558 length:159 start_codon:yes stop_codon:yes gene_type:complete